MRELYNLRPSSLLSIGFREDGRSDATWHARPSEIPSMFGALGWPSFIKPWWDVVCSVSRLGKKKARPARAKEERGDHLGGTPDLGRCPETATSTVAPLESSCRLSLIWAASALEVRWDSCSAIS